MLDHTPLPTTRASALVQHVASSGELTRILQPECQLAVWHRAVDRTIARGLRTADEAELPQARLVTPAANLRPALLAATSTLTDMKLRDLLVEDMVQLGHVFTDLLACTHLRVRLDATRRQTCPKFHRDNIAARLICTYSGPGTEWAITRGGIEPQSSESLRLFEVAVIKGEQWRNTKQKPDEETVVHRSPAIPSAVDQRLVVVMDPADGPETPA